MSSVSLFSNVTEKEFLVAHAEMTTIVNNLVTEDTFYVQISDCMSNGNICIDIPFDVIGDYSFSENGIMYADGFEGCMETFISTYDYSQLFGQGNIGPYLLNDWDVDGNVFSGEFANIPDLVDSMNLWDPTGNWVLDAGNQTISGGNPNLEYFEMDVTVVSINLTSSIPLNSSSSFGGTLLNFSAGTHLIQVIDNGGGMCVDSFLVNVRCIEPSTENFTIMVDSVETFCFDNSELLGQPVSTQILCQNTGLSPANFSLTGTNTCVNITGLSVGQDTACYVFCDNFGFCDTTTIYVTIEATPIQTGPEWLNETIYVNTSEQICLDTMDLSGNMVFMTNDCPDQSGEYVLFTLDAMNYCVNYSAIEVGKDTACIFLTDDLGNVDSTYIVVCVSNPTIDTVTQNILLGDTTSICIDSMQLGGTLLSMNNYCENSVGAVTFNNDTTAFCTEIIANQIGQDTACIVLCDDFGTCDTTIIIANVTSTDPTELTAVDDNAIVVINEVLTLDVCANDIIPKNEVLTNYYILPTSVGGIEPQYGTVSFESECIISYTPVGFDCNVVDSFMYVICTVDGCDTATVTINLNCNPSQGAELVFSNGFSPNGDEVNEFFEIQGAESYPNNSLSIFNRWGNQVYKADYYQNDWDGTFNGASLMNGTYFYVFEDGVGNTFSGYVYIQK